jgi:hypothetical protein
MFTSNSNWLLIDQPKYLKHRNDSRTGAMPTLLLYLTTISMDDNANGNNKGTRNDSDIVWT